MELIMMYKILRDYVKRYSSQKRRDEKVLHVLQILLADLESAIITKEKHETPSNR